MTMHVDACMVTALHPHFGAGLLESRRARSLHSRLRLCTRTHPAARTPHGRAMHGAGTEQRAPRRPPPPALEAQADHPLPSSRNHARRAGRTSRRCAMAPIRPCAAPPTRMPNAQPGRPPRRRALGWRRLADLCPRGRACRASLDLENGPRRLDLDLDLDLDLEPRSRVTTSPPRPRLTTTPRTSTNLTLTLCHTNATSTTGRGRRVTPPAAASPSRSAAPRVAGCAPPTWLAAARAERPGFGCGCGFGCGVPPTW